MFAHCQPFDQEQKYDVVVIGAPMDLATSSVAGQRDAPDYIRSSGHWHEGDLYDTVWGVDPESQRWADYGDIPIVWGDALASWGLITDEVSAVVPHTDRIVVLGGDNSVSGAVYEAVAGHHTDPPVLVHLDAHRDVWGPLNADYDHGTWVADLLDAYPDLEVVQIGVRGYGPSKAQWEKYERRITSFPMRAFEHDFRERLDEVVAKVAGRKAYLALDIDVADPVYAPGVGIAEPGGFTSRELLWLLRSVCTSADVVAMDVTEVLPMKDVAGLTGMLANRAVLSMAYRP